MKTFVNETNPYKSKQVYWCSVCDASRVYSDNPQTGKFYTVHGHEFDSSDYTSVFFAICTLCTLTDAIHEVKNS